MKTITLSLAAALATTMTFAGGDIAPVEPVVETPAPAVADCNKDTVISGKVTGYYYTDDTTPPDDMFGDQSQLGAAITLDAAHKLNDMIKLNFGAVGYANLIGGNDTTLPNFFEGKRSGAYFNVANIEANFADTTFVLGRQLIDTPMLGGFDWLLAPGSFEAAVVANKSIENLTLVGGYVNRWRQNNSGEKFVKLDGDNWTVGGVYGAGDLGVSAWYYNVDALDYSQVYADASYKFGDFNVAAQVASTDYGTATDGLLVGAKAEAEFSGIGLMAAVSQTSDNAAGYVGRDGIYTSSWNYFASNAAALNDDTLSWKVAANGKIAGISALASYAGYGDEGSELDVILGYDFTDAIDAGIVYTLTDYDVNTDTQSEIAAVEVFANYKF